MIIMDVKVDNFFAFKNFHMNMSYPKKIVDSTIEMEYLPERPNFRYKKVNIIMGGNATGKTSLGKVLMLFANYLGDGIYKRFTDRVTNINKHASIAIDFVTNENILHRFAIDILPKSRESYAEEDVSLNICCTPILARDNYEVCAKRLDNGECELTSYDKINTNGWSFSYPIDVTKDKTYNVIEDSDKYLGVLERVMKTLDPAVRAVVKVEEVANTYVIMWDNCSAIIKDGRIAEGEVMSSGTKAGLDIAYIITSLICNMHSLYYCDELFSYVNSDVEKACLSVIIDKLDDRKQLFFTTHNSDILDMQLPKHSYTFLKKVVHDESEPIKCVNAAQYLKRNTDSLKSAVDNDMFCTSPEVNKLFEIVEM